jgi:hypothetical protein
VHGRNRRLQGVGAEAPRSKRALGERDAFGDLVFIPQRAILVVQQDQLSYRGDARGAARFLQQHQPQQAHHLGFRKQVEKHSTQADRLAAQFGSCCLRRITRVEDQVHHLKYGSQPCR